MVGKVEGFEAELQLVTFGNSEVLQRREIPVKNSRCNQDVATDISERPERLYRESIRVEVTARGPGTLVKNGIGAIRVGPVETAPSLGTIGTRGDRHRVSGLDRDNRPKLPSSQQDIGGAPLVQ